MHLEHVRGHHTQFICIIFKTKVKRSYEYSPQPAETISVIEYRSCKKILLALPQVRETMTSVSTFLLTLTERCFLIHAGIQFLRRPTACFILSHSPFQSLGVVFCPDAFQIVEQHCEYVFRFLNLISVSLL